MNLRRLWLAGALTGGVLLSGCSAFATAPATRIVTAAASPLPAATAAPSTGVGDSPAPPPAGASAAAQVLPVGYDSSRNAQADIQSALEQAAKDDRNILIGFGADWCPDCTAMDAQFHSAEIEPLLLKSYHVVNVDVGRFNRNLDLAARYIQLKTSGIPALAVLSPQGTVLTATNDGAFTDARSMGPKQIRAFLTRWAAANRW